MSERPKSLREKYAAYYYRDVPPEDAGLTHVGPDTPCGEYLRRFWHPVAQSGDLKDLPRAIRILGEDLVIFRDGSGKVGLLLRHCAHRGTSLEYGFIEERGIRCCYHGWHFDVDGTILERPNAHESVPYSGTLHQGAYPVHEFGGLVFAYMGPPDKRPPFPFLDTFEVPGHDLCLGQPTGVSTIKPCNWLQVMDNVVDPAHEAFLHTRSKGSLITDREGRVIEQLAQLGALSFVGTSHGLLCQEARRVGEDVWIRSIEYIAPNIVQLAQVPSFPPTYGDGKTRRTFPPMVTRWRVPIDDAHTLELAFVRVRKGEENVYANRPSQVILSNYGGRPYEEMQRRPGDYEAQIGQRTVARHALENLVAADRGVTMMRRMIREGVQAVADGRDPQGIFRDLKGHQKTFGNDTVVRVACGSTAAEDAAIVERVAGELTQDFLRNPPMQVHPDVRLY